jgi:hypothetical protein
MPETKAAIDFASGQQSSNEALGGAIPQSVNVLVDSVGAIHVRPGISTWSDFGPSPSLSASTSVDGISVWDSYPVYVTSDRRIHAQLAPGHGVDLSDGTAPTMLDGGTRPVLCPSRVRIIIAGGGLLQKWEGPGTPLSANLGGDPPAATHVVKSNEYLVVNPTGLSGQIQWSDIGDAGEESWAVSSSSNAGFLELSADSDPLPALYQNTGELIGFGTRTVQTLDPTADTTATGVPIVWLNTRTWTQGCNAPYSFAQNDETFGFLDSLKRIQLSNGRAYQAISDPAITETLRNLDTVSDCWGFRMAIGSWDLLGWNFPTMGRTFVYDTTLKTWSEWRGFSGNNWAPWIAKSHFYWPDAAVHMVGMGDGTIAKMDTSSITDAGAPIVAEITSGFNDFGTDNWKQHISTRFTFKRGLGVSGASPGPVCQLFYRDSTGAWSDPIQLPLGDPSDPSPVIEVRSLGMFRTRQWRLRMSDSVPLTFVRAVCTFEAGEM